MTTFDAVPMTRKQSRMLDVLRRVMRDEGRYEIKKWRVAAIGYGVVMLIVESGMPNDEGTAAEILCRYHAQVFIGPRGRLTTYIIDKRRVIQPWEARHIAVYEREARARRARRQAREQAQGSPRATEE